MKEVFVDTNIIIDLLADRKPFSKFAVQLFSRAEKGEVRLYCSSHSVATTYYLMKKYMDEKKLREVLYSLLDYLLIIPTDIGILKKGLKSKPGDFEDALQILCAYSIDKMDCIVTRNIRDFKGAEIPVLTPEELAGQV